MLSSAELSQYFNISRGSYSGSAGRYPSWTSGLGLLYSIWDPCSLFFNLSLHQDLATLTRGADTIASAYNESLGSGPPMHPILTYPMLGASKSIASVEQSVHGDIFICSGVQSRAATCDGQRGLRTE
jgi:hypothetical protein